MTQALASDSTLCKCNFNDNGLNIDFYSNLLSETQCNELFQTLETGADWGNNITSEKRATRTYGDTGLSYRLDFYGKITIKKAIPWEELPILLHVRNLLQELTHQTYNICVIQRYPNGKVGIAAHKDREMTSGTTICGLSLGETRVLTMSRNSKRIHIRLVPGSIYVLNPPTNDYWFHSIEIDETLGPRISLTFRNYSENLSENSLQNLSISSLTSPVARASKITLRIKSPQVAVSSNVTIDSTRPPITLRIRDVVKMGTSVSSMSDNFHAPKFGIIFHWGLYSVPAYDDPVSLSNRRTQNGSEWYLKRLMETGNYRPLSGWKETQQYHQTHYGNRTYQSFVDDFTAEKWDPEQWMQICKSAGAKYVIITTKHHDGFCLWPTSSTDHNSMQAASKKDIVGMFRDAARRNGLLFGVYYSWFEFGQSCTIQYMDTIVSIQINELQTYKPDIWWFDGDWACTTKYANTKIQTLCDDIRRSNVHALINDRIGGGKDLKEQRKDLNFLGNASYRVYGDREIPNESPKVKWEHINTIGLSWGRNKAQTSEHYKTVTQLYDLYKEVTLKGGNFLLNLGPNSDGSLDPQEVSILEELSKFINVAR
jgi:alpha-L-fucosidase/alkylated DNA repair dioxygenase AlkB